MLFLFDFFFFKQKTAYEMRISDWSSDVCSSDLPALARTVGDGLGHLFDVAVARIVQHKNLCHREPHNFRMVEWRSEEHTSELQSLMRISYAVFCLKKKIKNQKYKKNASTKMQITSAINIHNDKRRCTEQKA